MENMMFSSQQIPSPTLLSRHGELEPRTPNPEQITKSQKIYISPWRSC